MTTSHTHAATTPATLLAWYESLSPTARRSLAQVGSPAKPGSVLARYRTARALARRNRQAHGYKTETRTIERGLIVPRGAGAVSIRVRPIKANAAVAA